MFKKILPIGLSLFIAGAALIGGASVSAHAKEDVSASSLVQVSAKDDRKELKQIMRDVVQHKEIPGMLAQVVKNGQTWSHAEGKASIDSGRKMSPDFYYRIGSITKTFVATVVLQLVGENKLSLDDTVERWLPGVVQGNGYDGNKITIRQLLKHTSGIADFLSGEFVKSVLTNPYRTYSTNKLIRLGLEQKPLFDPGTSWSYSNTNYLLVGLIIEKVTGESYAEQIKKRIIKPLKLNSTSVPLTSPFIPGPHARGYVLLNGQLHDLTELNPSMAGAAGNMISTARDLNKFFDALLGGRLLKPELMKQMLDTVDTPLGRYGLGIEEVKLSNGDSIWGHSGGIHGSGSYSFGKLGGKHVMSANINMMPFDGINIHPFSVLYEAEFGKSDR